MIPLVPLTAVAVSLATGDAPVASPPVETQQERPSLEERVLAMEELNLELRRRIDLLSEELEQTALGDAYVPVGRGQRGLSPAASKIYSASSPLSIGGYGEAVYTNNQGTLVDEADFLRAVLYVGYRFDDKWLLNTEFEFEHAGSGGGGSVSAEFAYLEYFATDELSLRFGLLLAPLGFVNELHEPTLFPSADRPLIEQRIIPSTWRENGFGVVGEHENFSYRAYVLNGLRGENFSAAGLRGGRQKGSEALADDLAVAARFDYTGVEGLVAGASAYFGNSGQSFEGAGSVQTTILDVHAEYNVRGFRGRFLGVQAQLDDVDRLNGAIDAAQQAAGDPALAANESIGEELEGYYLEAAYNVLVESSARGELLPFVRYSAFDTQAEVPDGFVSDPANDVEAWTFGVAYKPHPNLIFKADYVDIDNAAGTGVDQFRLSLGYVF